MERTFVMVKPDGVERGLVGEIIGRIEAKGFKLVGLKMLKLSQTMAERHYAEHRGKPFFQELVDFITASPVVAMVWEGNGVIESVRKLMGKTNPLEAEPGTIRGDFGVYISKNIIHGSDSPGSAAREIEIFFRPDELVEYQRSLDKWIF
ncbi:MAG TPA: nucleoside-diphosphate kinase [Syntrophothermus lipocalidus]|uniref:nucleoside-diphosphate kinase n=1 Tax=Syntrophothermus sp. TaxID=2736299 RepID=UPI0017D2E288|nr:nucleoside-diphosphate kinase [Syntrophothermus sp.]NSW82959.1 nucleoside-diphosphate kinase [Syntrophothermus sp.]HHV76106.1 nucleoside-diphosphate kinase [Syntrophothermus lipocalidus]HOV42980.1 nucleoside-diphosphate kinase [Syntrophothermus lipocalidus]